MRFKIRIKQDECSVKLSFVYRVCFVYKALNLICKTSLKIRLQQQLVLIFVLFHLNTCLAILPWTPVISHIFYSRVSKKFGPK